MSKPYHTHYIITYGYEFLDNAISLHPLLVPHKNSVCEILCETNHIRVSVEGELLVFTNSFVEPPVAAATVSQATDRSPLLRISSDSEPWGRGRLPSANTLRWSLLLYISRQRSCGQFRCWWCWWWWWYGMKQRSNQLGICTYVLTCSHLKCPLVLRTGYNHQDRSSYWVFACEDLVSLMYICQATSDQPPKYEDIFSGGGQETHQEEDQAPPPKYTECVSTRPGRYWPENQHHQFSVFQQHIYIF